MRSVLGVQFTALDFGGVVPKARRFDLDERRFEREEFWPKRSGMTGMSCARMSSAACHFLMASSCGSPGGLVIAVAR